MSRNGNASVALLLPALVLLAAAGPAFAQAPAAGEWKIFQEFNFLVGSWSRSADSGGRIGGRVVSFGLEVDGATLGYRATTFYAAREGQPESRSEEIAKIVYDGAKGKYVALVVFSTKAWGIFEAEVRPDGSIVFSAKEMANFEPGTRSRWTLARKADGTVGETAPGTAGGAASGTAGAGAGATGPRAEATVPVERVALSSGKNWARAKPSRVPASTPPSA